MPALWCDSFGSGFSRLMAFVCDNCGKPVQLLDGRDGEVPGGAA